MRSNHSLLSLALLPLLACGGGGGGGGGGTIDAPHGGSGIDAPGSAAACLASSYSSAPTGATADDEVDPASGSGSDAMVGDEFEQYLGNLDATTGIDLELYTGTLDFPGETLTAGSKTLAGSDAQYATCGTCLFVEGLDSDGNVLTQYLAQSGTVNITATQGTFNATVTNAALIEVDEDENFMTTPDPDGCATSIPSMTLTATVTNDSGSAAEVPTSFHGKLPAYLVQPTRHHRIHGHH